MIKKHLGLLAEIIVALVALAITALWFVYTDAYMNEQALHTFYQPILRGIHIFQHFFPQGFDLILETHDYPFPYGIYIFPLFFYLLGGGNLILQMPFILCLLLLALLMVACSCSFGSSRQSISLFLLIFCFPLFQVSLKGFSPHSWNTLCGFLFFVFFERFTKTGNRKNLLIAMISGIMCISIKHFGLSIVVLYFLCRIFAALCRRQAYVPDLLYLCGCVGIGGLFYPRDGLWGYAKAMFQHNPRFSCTDSLGIVIVFLILISFCIWLVRAKSPLFTARKLAGKWFFIPFYLLFLGLYLALIWQENYQSTHLYLFLSLYALMTCCSWRWIPLNAIGNYIFFYTSLGMGFFLFLFASHIDFLVFPFLILFYLAIQENLVRSCLILLCLSGLIVSNLSNSSSEKLNAYGEISCFALVEEHVFNSFSWNPWSWQPRQMNQIKREMEILLNPFLSTNQELTGFCTNMNFKATQEMIWSPYFNFADGLINLGDEKLILEKIIKHGETNFFHDLHQAKRIEIIIEALAHWDQYNENENLNLTYFIEELNTHQELNQALKAEFLTYLSQRWLKFLRETQLLKDYNSYLLPADYPLVLLHIRHNVSSVKGDSPEPLINQLNLNTRKAVE